MSPVSVRYNVDDEDAAIAFYGEQLGFEVEMHPAPTFAILRLGDLRLLLSAPSGLGGGGQVLADGRRPEPGGWNRFSLEVAELKAMVDRLRHHGVRMRSDIVQGVGGDQVIVEDPAGNPIELFQPHPGAS